MPICLSVYLQHTIISNHSDTLLTFTCLEPISKLNQVYWSAKHARHVTRMKVHMHTASPELLFCCSRTVPVSWPHGWQYTNETFMNSQKPNWSTAMNSGRCSWTWHWIGLQRTRLIRKMFGQALCVCDLCKHNVENVRGYTTPGQLVSASL